MSALGPLGGTDSSKVSLRPVEPEDEPFLLRVYAGTRLMELAHTSWDEVQKEAFLKIQYAAQKHHYLTYYPEAEHQVICANERPVGRLYLARLPEEFRILDIAILPENRNTGIGTFVLRGILADAQRAGLPVTISVENFNPSLRIFEQLGFRKTKDDGLNFLLQWGPAPPGQSSKRAPGNVTGPND